MSLGPREILDFWFKEIPSEKWFATDPVLDATITGRFGKAWGEARAGAYQEWEQDPESALALIILTDQFPRNMFRGDPRAFSTDAQAREIAKRAVVRGFDRAVAEAERPFFYMPLMHSEDLADQDLCVALCQERLAPGNKTLPFAEKHRIAIARFGRFPARNKALGRESTAEEAAFLSSPDAW
jgi:uncharacterized protein (DUF924 family)